MRKVLFVLLVLSGFIFTPINVNATVSGTNGKIVFTSLRDGNNEIYIMNSDGTGLTNLTNNPALEINARWSPDGTKIVFVSDRDGNREIYTMNADGSNQTRITNNSSVDQQPAYSPDGTKIVFNAQRDGNQEIYTMNIDGTNPVRLTNSSGETDQTPQYSPNGLRIAWGKNPAGQGFDVYTMNSSDGSNVTRLTNDGSASTADSIPNWSPNGSKIVFTSGRDGNNEIYVMNSDGTGQTRITNNSASDTDAKWSPDGTKIVFDSGRDGNTEIYTMNSDGSNQTRITNNSASDNDPDWQPLSIVVTPTPTSVSSSNSSTAQSSPRMPEAPQCGDEKPSSNPDLFQVDVTDTHATLHYTPSGNPYTYYYIAYGYDDTVDRFGVQIDKDNPEGIQTYTINELTPNTKYFFKIRGGNGCQPGDWSKSITIKTAPAKTVYTYIYYAYYSKVKRVLNLH